MPSGISQPTANVGRLMPVKADKCYCVARLAFDFRPLEFSDEAVRSPHAIDNFYSL
jgi:hypothetical protein